MIEEQQLPQFSDGSVYERNMGRWSQLAGRIFIDWLASPAGLAWIDVGCGNGAFTEMLMEHCAPATLKGVDPSEGQLAYARTRPVGKMAEFSQGNADDLPFADNTFDAAVMALVIYFVPEPARGLSEMVRVVRSGGVIAAYTWDHMRGGAPLEVIQDEMRALGVSPPRPPSADASRMEETRKLWTAAGLEQIETKEIQVQRTFADFEQFWTTSLGGSVGTPIAKMVSNDVERLKARVRARLSEDVAGRVTCSAKANAIKGRVPK